MAKLKQKPVIPSIVKGAGLVGPYLRGELQITKEPDEENPKQNVTRLRRKDFLSELHNRQIITHDQYQYGNQYAILCEKAEGGNQDLYAKISLLSVSRNKWEPTYSQHEAYEQLFLIWEGMGKFNIQILNMVVLGDMNASQIGKVTGSTRHSICGMIKMVFDSLENIFDKLKKTSCTM